LPYLTNSLPANSLFNLISCIYIRAQSRDNFYTEAFYHITVKDPIIFPKKMISKIKT
jgi:hypothetical protein